MRAAEHLGRFKAQFKTFKYCSAFPGRFGSIADARSFCPAFFDHYNHVHRSPRRHRAPHASIGPLRHRHEIQAARAETLTAAYNANPARFRHQPPTPPKLREVAWINEPNRVALIIRVGSCLIPLTRSDPLRCRKRCSTRQCARASDG